MRQTFAAYKEKGDEFGISLEIRYDRVYEPYGLQSGLRWPPTMMIACVSV
jgi:hypothetical protein